MTKTDKDATASGPEGADIPCPKCHQPAGEVRPGIGMLEFKCRACGHQWWLFDRSPQQGSDR